MGNLVARAGDRALLNSGGGIPLLDRRGATYQSWTGMMRMTPNVHAEYPGLVLDYRDDPAWAWASARALAARRQYQPDPRIVIDWRPAIPLQPIEPARMSAVAVRGGELLNGRPMLFMGTIIASAPAAVGSWVLTVNMMHAPVQHAAEDFPAPLAMAGSVTINNAELAANCAAISAQMVHDSDPRLTEGHDGTMALTRSRSNRP